MDSFDVYECPMFELMEEIKIKLVENVSPKNKTLCIILKMLFEERKTYQEIADELGCAKNNIYKICCFLSYIHSGHE